METSMVSRSIISMSSKPLSARVLSSSHPMPPAPTMRTTDRDEGGAGRVSVAGWASDASKIRDTRTFRILGELEIAHGRRHRGRQARASRARRAFTERDHASTLEKPKMCARTSSSVWDECKCNRDTKRASRRGYASARRRGRWRRLPVEPSLQNARVSPRLAFTSASPATALWRSCRT